MFTIEVHNSINQIFTIFYNLSLWRKEDESHYRSFGWKFLHFIIFLSFSLSMGLGAFLSDDKNESVFLAAMTIVSLVLSVKLAYILRKKEDILSFLRDICVHCVEHNNIFIQISEKLGKFWKFVFWYLVMTTLGASCLILLPVFLRMRVLPLSIWFPLDWKKSDVAYCIAYVYLMALITMSVVITLFVAIIWYVMLNCSIKYEILGNQLKNMGTITTTNSAPEIPTISETQIQSLLVRDFITLIQTHQNIQETINRFKSCFSNLFLVQIVTSGIGICGSVYILVFTSGGNLFQLGVYVVLLFYNLFDIFMVMYFGNEIRISSNQLSYCLFESDCIGRSRAARTCIIIMTEVLKQPHELVIYKLYPMNLETFSSIINLAYTMFNNLRNFK